MNLDEDFRFENATSEYDATDPWPHDNVTLDATLNITSNVTLDATAGKMSLGFVDSVVKSFSVMIVSELGDKTFFLAGEMHIITRPIPTPRSVADRLRHKWT